MQKKNIIIIFPSDIDQFRVANYSFRSFNSDEAKPGTEFFHVVHSDHRESFQVRNGSVYDVSDDYKLLLKNRYSLAVDLTFGDDPALAKMMKKIKSDTKIGFVENKLVKYLNIRIQISKDDPIEKGFLNMIRMIGAV